MSQEAQFAFPNTTAGGGVTTGGNNTFTGNETFTGDVTITNTNGLAVNSAGGVTVTAATPTYFLSDGTNTARYRIAGGLVQFGPVDTAAACYIGTGAIVAGNGAAVYTDGTQVVMIGVGGVNVAHFAVGAVTLDDAVNIVFNATTGTKIGTATSQKFSFWNAVPAAQQVLATGAGKSADDIITFLQSTGLCRQS